MHLEPLDLKMINIMDERQRGLDPQLWHACAGGMVQMPPLNSKVFYFPQGHAEHASKNVDFGNFPRFPPLVLCRVLSIEYLADNETDEVYAKIRLFPLKGNESDVEGDDDFLGFDKDQSEDKPNSFAKTLTQSDANNGGGFSVPRYCAETIFPRLDYSAEPPLQTILAKDVHGEVWKFRHIYRGTPRRHLLTTGWSNFVNQKKLVAGDSVVFLRAENGDLCVGIRRAKKGIGCGPEAPSGWNPGGVSGFLVGDDKFNGNGNGGNGVLKQCGKVSAESVLEAATLATNGQPFEVIHSPRLSAPEFVVKASSVGAAMRVQWCSGMRFKMPFETEDSSRISWFMGTISSVQVDDPIHWPNSLWRLLQVAWDEPQLLQNVKRVSPWLVELVSNMPAIHLSPFSPPRKKLRLPQLPEFPLFGQIQMPSLLSNPLSHSGPFYCFRDNIPAGTQGARHTESGLPSSQVLFNKLQEGLLTTGFRRLDHDLAAPPTRYVNDSFSANSENDEMDSCLLTVGKSIQSSNTSKETKTPMFVLFGKPILTEMQIASQCYSEDTDGKHSAESNLEKTTNHSDGSGSTILQNFPSDNSSDGIFPSYKEKISKFGSEIGQSSLQGAHGRLESVDVGRHS